MVTNDVIRHVCRRAAIAPIESKCINHFNSGRFGKGKQAIDVCFVGNWNRKPVGGIPSHPKTLDAELTKHCDERLVIGTKKMTDDGVCKNVLHFKTQADEVRYDRLPRGLRININGHCGLRAGVKGRDDKVQYNETNPRAT